MMRVQILGGTTTAANGFTGFSRELYVDTGNNEIRVHDGTTEGGWRIPNLTFNDARYSALNTFMTNVAALSATAGLVASAGAANAAAAVTITGTSKQIKVVNGTGAAGNPTISVASTFQITGLTVAQLSSFNGGFVALDTAQVTGLTATGVVSLQDGLSVAGNASLATTAISGLSGTLIGTLALGTQLATGGTYENAVAAINALGSITGSNAVNLALGNIITATQNSSALTFTFSNWLASGILHRIYFIITLDSTPHTVTFTGISWDSVIGAPTLVASKKLCVMIESNDGGSTLRGAFVGCF